MSMQDTLADMLTSIRNAQMAYKDIVTIPSSKIKKAVAQVLKDEGYISSFNIDETEKNKPNIYIKLKYFKNKPVIEDLKRISRPGLRQYKSVKNLPKVKGGLGISIISTNKGVMTDKKAILEKRGGEILCIVY